jgi:hypothetical protein
MTTSTDKIKELQRQIEAEQHKINNCVHKYGEPFYNPETVKEGYGSVQVGSGSDPWWDFAGYRDVKVDRWTKKCTLCGHEIHTRSTKPIIKGFEPDFK